MSKPLPVSRYDKGCTRGIMEYNKKYWDDRLTKDTPERVKRAIKRVYGAYPKECLPQGVCDPMYIMNVICLELGVGDGQGNFNLKEV